MEAFFVFQNNFEVRMTSSGDSRQLAKKTGSDGLKADEVPEGVGERASVDSTLEEVNIHGKNDIFREEMKGAIDRGRIDLATEALALCGSGDVEEYDLMWSSAQYTAIVFDVLDHTWHRIKHFKSKIMDISVLNEIAILAGGSGGRRELSVMSDLEIMAVVPVEENYDKLVTLFMVEAKRVGIHIDAINKPTRRKGSIATTVQELVDNVFLNGLDEVQVSMLIEASVVAGNLKVEHELKETIETYMGTPLSDVPVRKRSQQSQIDLFMKGEQVNPEKDVLFGDFVQMNMENWKLLKATSNMEVLRQIASGKKTTFDIKKDLYRGIQTSIQLLSYYASREEVPSASGGSSGMSKVSSPPAGSALRSTKAEVVPKRKVRQVTKSATLETLAKCSRLGKLGSTCGMMELRTVVGLRVAAHNYHGVENDKVMFQSEKAVHEKESRETMSTAEEGGGVQAKSRVDLGALDVGHDTPSFPIPPAMVPNVYKAIALSGALQETWMILSSGTRINERDNFLETFDSVFSKKIAEWNAICHIK